MSNNQYTIDEGIAWPLTVTNLQRAMEKRHRRAGELKPDQHVFTIDDIVVFAKAYGRHVGNSVWKANASERNKRKIIKNMLEKLLLVAANGYKQLNKTP